jgi:hypothetical protein
MRRIAPAFLVLTVLALPLAAAAPSDDGLSLVPPDAATAGLVHVTDLRTSPLFDRVFSETDRISCDAEGARFLSEAGLNPRQDVDLVVFAAAPGTDGAGWALVAFEGRFDPVKLAAATAAQGAAVKTTVWGDYFLLPERKGGGTEHGRGAIAYVSSRLVVAGSETAVVQALARRASGGGGFAAGEGLGRQMSHIDPKASAWVLVDMSRVPAKRRAAGDGGDSPAAVLVTAMKSVSFAALSVTVQRDALKLSATGVSDDAETRQDLGDAVRGVLAIWRMAVQEKHPDLVPVLRAFKVTEGKDSVTLSGTLPGASLRALTEKGSATKS